VVVVVFDPLVAFGRLLPALELRELHPLLCVGAELALHQVDVRVVAEFVRALDAHVDHPARAHVADFVQEADLFFRTILASPVSLAAASLSFEQQVPHAYPPPPAGGKLSGIGFRFPHCQRTRFALEAQIEASFICKDIA